MTDGDLDVDSLSLSSGQAGLLEEAMMISDEDERRDPLWAPKRVDQSPPPPPFPSRAESGGPRIGIGPYPSFEGLLPTREEREEEDRLAVEEISLTVAMTPDHRVPSKVGPRPMAPVESVPRQWEATINLAVPEAHQTKVALRKLGARSRGPPGSLDLGGPLGQRVTDRAEAALRDLMAKLEALPDEEAHLSEAQLALFGPPQSAPVAMGISQSLDQRVNRLIAENGSAIEGLEYTNGRVVPDELTRQRLGLPHSSAVITENANARLDSAKKNLKRLAPVGQYNLQKVVELICNTPQAVTWRLTGYVPGLPDRVEACFPTPEFHQEFIQLGVDRTAKVLRGLGLPVPKIRNRVEEADLDVKLKTARREWRKRTEITERMKANEERDKALRDRKAAATAQAKRRIQEERDKATAGIEEYQARIRQAEDEESVGRDSVHSRCPLESDLGFQIKPLDARVAYYRFGMSEPNPPGGLAAEKMDIFRAVCTLACRKVDPHFESTFPHFANISPYELYRAEEVILSSKVLGGGQYGNQMPGVLTLVVDNALFAHLAAIYEILNLFSGKLVGAIFFVGLEDFTKTVAQVHSSVQSNPSWTAEVVEDLNQRAANGLFQRFQETCIHLKKPPAPEGHILVILHPLLHREDPQQQAWEHTLMDLYHRLEAVSLVPDDTRQRYSLIGDTAVSLLPQDDREGGAMRLNINKGVAAGDLGTLYLHFERIIGRAFQTRRQLVLNPTIAINAAVFQETTRRMANTDHLRTVQMGNEANWLRDTSIVVETEYRQPLYAQTPAGQGSEALQAISSIFEALKSASYPAGEWYSYEFTSMSGVKHGPVEKSLVELNRLLLENFDSYLYWVLTTRISFTQLGELFPDSEGNPTYTWVTLLGSYWAEWDPKLTPGWQSASTGEREKIRESLRTLRLVDLLALMISSPARREIAITGGLRVLCQQEWHDGEIAAFLALGGGIEVGRLMGRYEKFLYVQRDRRVAVLRLLAAEASLPSPAEAGVKLQLQIPHLKDLLTPQACTALWGMGACELPPGFLSMRSSLAGNMAYLPLLINSVGHRTGETDWLRARSYPRGPPMRYHQGYPSRPDRVQVATGMKVITPELSGVKARQPMDFLQESLPGGFGLLRLAVVDLKMYKRGIKRDSRGGTREGSVGSWRPATEGGYETENWGSSRSHRRDSGSRRREREATPNLMSLSVQAPEAAVLARDPQRNSVSRSDSLGRYPVRGREDGTDPEAGPRPSGKGRSKMPVMGATARQPLTRAVVDGLRENPYLYSIPNSPVGTPPPQSPSQLPFLVGSDTFLGDPKSVGQSPSRPVGCPLSQAPTTTPFAWLKQLDISEGLLSMIQERGDSFATGRDTCPRCVGGMQFAEAEVSPNHALRSRIRCVCTVQDFINDFRKLPLPRINERLNGDEDFTPMELNRFACRYAHPDSWCNWMAWQLCCMGVVAWEVDLAIPLYGIIREYAQESENYRGLAGMIKDSSKYSAVVPVGYAAIPLGSHTWEFSQEGGIPCGVIPRPLTVSTYQFKPKREQTPVRAVYKVRLQEDADAGTPPPRLEKLRGALLLLSKHDTPTVQEGRAINCHSVVKKTASPRESCTLQMNWLRARSTIARPGVKTLATWNAAELVDTMGTMSNRDVWIVELWAWPALRSLYVRAGLEGPPNLTPEDIREDYDTGEVYVPTLTEVFVRVCWTGAAEGGQDVLLTAHTESTRRAVMVQQVIRKTLGYQSLFIGVFSEACPIQFSRWTATRVMSEYFRDEAFMNWQGPSQPAESAVLRLLTGYDRHEPDGCPPIHNLLCRRVIQGQGSQTKKKPSAAAPQVTPRLLHGQWTLLREARVAELGVKHSKDLDLMLSKLRTAKQDRPADNPFKYKDYRVSELDIGDEAGPADWPVPPLNSSRTAFNPSLKANVSAAVAMETLQLGQGDAPRGKGDRTCRLAELGPYVPKADHWDY